MNVAAKITDDGQELTGRAKVRFHLIDPVVATGMRRKRGVSEDDHKAWLAKLADELAYLSPRNLDALQSFVVRWAGGKQKNVWPEMVSIVSAAYALQPIPSREHKYAKSVIRSAMGRDAHVGGYLLELFEVARKWGPPPNKYVLSRLRQEAEANRMRRRRFEAELAAGRGLTSDDGRWLRWYVAELEWCEAVAMGNE